MSETEPHSPVENPALEGYTVVRNFWGKYWSSQKGTFVSPRPKCSGTYGDENKFNVWSVAVATQAVVDGARLYPEELSPLVAPAADALAKYRSPELHGYCAVENFNGNQDIYYDDDAQVASALIGCYEVTGDKRQLDRARELVRYLMGGWNKDSSAEVKHKGGVLWHRDKPYISAISTSECAAAALRLAKLIPSEAQVYTEFGERATQWVLDNLLDKSDYLVLDGVDKFDSNPNGMKWTYNTGVLLSCVVLLYQLTGKDTWRKHADELAAASTNRNKSLFCRDYNEFDRRYWRDPSYFIQLLFEGLADYLLVVGNKAPESTSNAIKNEFKRHLVFFRKYLYDDKDGLYFQTFEAYRISKEVHALYCKQFGTTKGFDANNEERAQEGPGSPAEKQLVKTLIGSGAAARIWFQAARVLPEIKN